MVRFYGVGVLALDADLGDKLFKSIECLEAEEDLRMIQLLDFPHLKEEPRRKIFKDLKKRLDRNVEKEEGKALTLEELGRVIQNG